MYFPNNLCLQKSNKLKNNVGSASSRSGKLGKKHGCRHSGIEATVRENGQPRIERYTPKVPRNETNCYSLFAISSKTSTAFKTELMKCFSGTNGFERSQKAIATLVCPNLNVGKSAHLLYKKSAQALCRGDVSRGKTLLEEALKKEDTARESLPEQVEERLDAKDKVMTGSPVSTASEGGEICPSTRAPKELNIADKSLSVRATVRTASPVRRTPAFNWWKNLRRAKKKPTPIKRSKQKRQRLRRKERL